MAHQGGAHRGLHRDAVLERVGLARAHEREVVNLAIGVDDGHRAAERSAKNARRVELSHLGERVADLADAGLVLGLLLLGIIELGVLREVAEVARDLDALTISVPCSPLAPRKPLFELRWPSLVGQCLAIRHAEDSFNAVSTIDLTMITADRPRGECRPHALYRKNKAPLMKVLRLTRRWGPCPRRTLFFLCLGKLLLELANLAVLGASPRALPRSYRRPTCPHGGSFTVEPSDLPSFEGSWARR